MHRPPHGTNFTRPRAIELECAELFVDLDRRSAEMVKFTKDGSTATSAALKLARAFTGRDLVAICVDHPFFSYDDWFMVATPDRGGIPASVEAMTADFRYNDLASVEELLARTRAEIAASSSSPSVPSRRDGFLERLQRAVPRDGALLVLDEIVTGFRWTPAARRLCTASRPISRRGARRSPTASRSRRLRDGAS